MADDDDDDALMLCSDIMHINLHWSLIGSSLLVRYSVLVKTREAFLPATCSVCARAET